MDRGAWRATAHGVIKSHTTKWLSLLPLSWVLTFFKKLFILKHLYIHRKFQEWHREASCILHPNSYILHNFTTVSGEGNGNPLQSSCLENPMVRGAWQAAVHGVTKSRTWLRDFTFTFHFHVLEKEMATHSSVLAWRIPGTGEPGGLPSTGSHKVGHDWSDWAAAAVSAQYQNQKQVPFRVEFYVIWATVYVV